MFPRIFTLLSIVLIAAPAYADEPQEDFLPEDGWPAEAVKDVTRASSFTGAKGKRCVVLTTGRKATAKAVARYADVFLKSFRKVFKGRFKIEERLTIRIFAHESEFKAYYSHVRKRDGSRLRKGVYLPAQKETWVRLVDAGDRKHLPRETLKHELVHHLLHFFTGVARLPAWFTEGTACVFQYWNNSQSTKENIANNVERANGGDYGYFPRKIKEVFGTEKFVAPSRLMALSGTEFQLGGAEVGQINYSESWALVNFLVSTKKGQKFFNILIRGLSRGKKLETLFSSKTLDSLQKAWYEDIKERLCKP